VENFTRDVSDGENYTILLNQLKPEQCSKAPLQTSDLHQRAEQVLDNADKIGCRRFLTPNSLVGGNPKLNLAFVANLFNNHPGLAPLEEAEAPPEIEDFDAEGEREARVFTLWLNSLDVEPGVWNFFENLKVSHTFCRDRRGVDIRTDTFFYKDSIKLSPVQLSGDESRNPKKTKNCPDSKQLKTRITPST